MPFLLPLAGAAAGALGAGGAAAGGAAAGGLSLSSVAAIGSTIAGVGGSLITGLSGAAASDYQAQVARNNAQIAGNEATEAIAAGHQQAAVESMKGADVMGRIRAAFAANGVDPNSGSAVTVQESQRAADDLDSAQTLQKAQLSSYGYGSQSTNFTAQAGLDELQGGNDTLEGIFGGASSFFKSSSSLGFLGGSYGGGFGGAPGGGGPAGGGFIFGDNDDERALAAATGVNPSPW
jgi:hypothetical protein